MRRRRQSSRANRLERQAASLNLNPNRMTNQTASEREAIRVDQGREAIRVDQGREAIRVDQGREAIRVDQGREAIRAAQGREGSTEAGGTEAGVPEVDPEDTSPISGRRSANSAPKDPRSTIWIRMA